MLKELSDFGRKCSIFGTSLLIIATLAIPTYASEVAVTDAESSYGELVLQGKRVHQLYSDVVDQLYEVHINLPANYDDNDATRYPIIYVLDGQWDFTLVDAIYGKANFDGMIPDAIIAGITWADDNANYNALRSRDYLPTPLPFIPGSGGAPLFLQALESELIPKIENLYKGDFNRVLMGTSFGGIFSSYAMLEKPYLFNSYISIAAPYQIDSYFSQRVDEIANTSFLRGIKAYFGAGNLDANLSITKAFYRNLENSELKGYRSKFQASNNFGHAGGGLMGYSNGLQYAFQRPKKKLSNQLITEYAGTYISVDGFLPITLIPDGKKMLFTRPGTQDLASFAFNKNSFYVNGSDIEYTITNDDSGNKLLTVYWQGNPFSYLTQ